MNVARSFVFASVVAAAALVSVPQHAAAQAASYCGGVIVADSFYSTMSSNGKMSNVEYFVQLRKRAASLARPPSRSRSRSPATSSLAKFPARKALPPTAACVSRSLSTRCRTPAEPASSPTASSRTM